MVPGRGVAPSSGDEATLAAGRRWAAAALEAGLQTTLETGQDGRTVPSPPPLPEWVWTHLAVSDRVASSLTRALGGAGHPVPDALRRVARRDEQQRLLLLAGALEVVRVAGAAGVRVLFLKGGAELGDPAADVTGDLDLLVRVEELPMLAAALERAGWPGGSGLDPARERAVRLEQRGGLCEIDLHTAGYDWDRPLLEGCFREAQPMAGIPGGEVPAPHHRAWQLLLHGILQHPERWGALRDLRRLRRLALPLSPEGAAWLARRMQQHREGARLAELWSAATRSLGALAEVAGGHRAAWLRESLRRAPLPAGRYAIRRHQFLFALEAPRTWGPELLRRQARMDRHLPDEHPLPWTVAARWHALVPLRLAHSALLVLSLLPRWAGARRRGR